MYAPLATASTPGVAIVYPAPSCTTFSSDTGTITPFAGQKAAEMFAITRPPKRSTSNPAYPKEPENVTPGNIVRWKDTDADVSNSNIKIEDVTNTKDTSKKAQVISIPAEGGKKMVYGYCTDQTDGTSFIGGIFDTNATSYPYSAGLAIGGTSGNLLWKGKRVLDANDLTAINNAIPTKTGDLINDNIYLTLSGGTMSGPITLPGNPTNNLEATTKQYVDNAINNTLGDIEEILAAL